MTGDPLCQILNFRRLDQRVATAGQPTEEQLRLVAEAGFRTVINLALPTSPGALADERASVTALGLDYVHIPVDFAAPAAADFSRFTEALDNHGGEPVLVHCALNYRASAFMAIHRVRRLGWKPGAALVALREIWEPDEVWTRFLAEQTR